MALGVHTECTKLWKLDDLALIVDSVESYIVDAVRAQHIKTGNDYLNILLYTFGKSITTMREIVCPLLAFQMGHSLWQEIFMRNLLLYLFLRNIGRIATFKIMWMIII